MYATVYIRYNELQLLEKRMIREIGTPLIRKSIIGYVEYRLLENIFFIGYHESHLLGKGSCYNQDSLYPFTRVN